MSLDTTPVTLTLPRWYVERLSEDAEKETLHYACRVRESRRRAATGFRGVEGYLDSIIAGKARWEAIESAITDALDGAEVTA